MTFYTASTARPASPVRHEICACGGRTLARCPNCDRPYCRACEAQTGRVVCTHCLTPVGRR